MILTRRRNSGDTDRSGENERTVRAADDRCACRRDTGRHRRSDVIVRMRSVIMRSMIMALYICIMLMRRAMVMASVIVALMAVTSMVVRIMFVLLRRTRFGLFPASASDRSRPCGQNRGGQQGQNDQDRYDALCRHDRVQPNRVRPEMQRMDHE